jgi:hypothetical protein
MYNTCIEITEKNTCIEITGKNTCMEIVQIRYQPLLQTVGTLAFGGGVDSDLVIRGGERRDSSGGAQGPCRLCETALGLVRAMTVWSRLGFRICRGNGDSEEHGDTSTYRRFWEPVGD